MIVVAVLWQKLLEDKTLSLGWLSMFKVGESRAIKLVGMGTEQ
jgi:hypothetical protein